MTLGINVTTRNAMLDSITSRAGASALLRIYSGTRPATGGTVPPGDGALLAQLTYQATFAPAAASGILSINAPGSSSAVASGTASFFRITQSNGTTHVLDGSVSTQAAGTGDLQLDDTGIVLGGTVSVPTNTLTSGNP